MWGGTYNPLQYHLYLLKPSFASQPYQKISLEIILLRILHHHQHLVLSKNNNNMAESFLFSMVENVLKQVGSFTLQEIGLAWGVESELKKLKDLSSIKAVLLDADEQHAKNCQLSVWLEKVKDVCHDAEDVLEEAQYSALRQQVLDTHGSFKTKVRNFLSYSNLELRFKMGHKIKEIRERLDGIAADKANFHLTKRVEDRRVVHMGRETHSFVHAPDVIGRDEDKEHIVQLLMHSCEHENVSIISVVGIGGLGTC